MSLKISTTAQLEVITSILSQDEIAARDPKFGEALVTMDRRSLCHNRSRRIATFYSNLDRETAPPA